MGLVICEDCGREMSDRAPACPHCGRPGNPAVTIEQTGKRWKGHRLIAAAIGWPSLILALIFAVSGNGSVAQVFGALFAAAALYEGTVRVLAWWHHG